MASAFYATDRAKGAEAKKAVAELQVKDPAAPADEFARIACDGAALEIEAEPLEEAAERIAEDVDASIEPNVAPEGFLRRAATVSSPPS